MRSYNILKKMIGEYDSLVELQEICIRNLKSNLSDKKTFTRDLNKLADDNKIFFNSENFDRIEKLQYRNYITIAYSAFDEFTKNITKDLNKFFGSYNRTKDSEETKLDFLIERMNSQIASFKSGMIKNKQEYLILDYYRIIRNQFIHPSDYKIENVDRAYNKIQKKELDEKYKKYSGLPNKAESIGFNDFIFLSKVIQDFAFDLSSFLHPQLEKYLDLIDEKKYVRYGLESERFLNSIAAFLVTEYSLSSDDGLYIAKLMKQKILEKKTP